MSMEKTQSAPLASGILVGCCGFAENQERYFCEFEAVEIQQTFYEPPRVETAARWRERAGPGFHFALKAWQAITHEPSSPTYRRMRTAISSSARARMGSFRRTREVDAAWQRTVDCALAMRAEVVLLQCPASFRPSPENVANLRHFCNRVERHGLLLAWEPRGRWPGELIVQLCRELDLVHALDPFQQELTTVAGVRYFRLHGIGGAKYRYTADDLHRLAGLVGDGPAYVFFNNVHMLDDARQFRDLAVRQFRK